MHYGFTVFWSDRDDAYIATCPEFPGLSAFGDSPQKAIDEATLVLEAFVEEYEEEGVALPEPYKLDRYSGQTRIRMPRSLHATLARRAEHEGVSLNHFMVYCLSHAAGGTEVEERFEALALQLLRHSERVYRNVNDVQKSVGVMMERVTSDTGGYQDPELQGIHAEQMKAE